jgi:hypothetical protein
MKMAAVDEIQEDEKGTRRLLASLPKDVWDNKVKGAKLYDWLAHPLVLLLIGAIVTSFLFPYLTRGWQDHQRGLELKANLIDQINETTEGALAELSEVEFRDQYNALSKDATVLNALHTLFIEQFHTWNVKAETILSQLTAYFSSYPKVRRDWQELSRAIGNLWNLSLLSDTKARNYQILSITIELKEICRLQVIDTNAYCKNLSFLNNLLPFSYANYGDNIVQMDTQSWELLEFTLRSAEDYLVQLILDTPISVRNTMTSWWD